MRNYSKTVGALAAASALVAGNALAEIEGEVHVGYASMYEFRFVDYGNSLIESGVDLAWSQGGPWSANVGAWYGSFDTPGILGSNANLNNDELDLYAGVSYELNDMFIFDAGYVYYYYPDGGGKTQEVNVGVSGNIWRGLGYGSLYSYDFDAGSGWYWDNHLTYSWEINACTSLELAAGFAYSSGLDYQGNARAGYAGYGSCDGMQGWYLSAQLPWQIRENLVLTPYVKYTDGDGDLYTGPNALDRGQQFLIGGVKVAVSF